MLPLSCFPAASGEQRHRQRRNRRLSRGGIRSLLFLPGPRQGDQLKRPDLRKEVPKERLERRSSLLKSVNDAMPEMEKQSSVTLSIRTTGRHLTSYRGACPGRIRSVEGNDAVRDRYGRHTFGPKFVAGAAFARSGTRFVQVNCLRREWRSNVDAWDTHAANFGPLRNLHCPKT
jgi:hypothetical protein